MTTTTLKISAFDPGRDGYPVSLTEEGHAPTEGLLPRAAFGAAGEWMVPLAGAAAAAGAAGKDIVKTVVETAGRDRSTVSWAGLGAALFNLLFPAGPLRERYKSWGQDIRLHLDVEPEELRRVPWELGCSTQPERCLALHQSLSRLHASVPGSSGSSEWPFRILILVGCSRSEEAELQADQEVSLITRTFVELGRSVDLRVVRTPRYEDLVALIKGKDEAPYERWEPHVLHFVGHTAPGGDGSIGLSFNLREGGASNWVWTPQAIQKQLPLLGWVPRFVFLNACRTGTEQAGIWGLQRSFVDAGTQCVLTMQADVLGSLAGLFAQKLYKYIATGQSVQAGTHEGRLAVYNKQPDVTRIDWALPSLTASAPSLVLFKPRDPPVDVDFGQCREFKEARIFANCHEARRLLTHWVCPVRHSPGNPPLPNVLLLTGEALCGKSHLLKWAMESWAVAGARVRYLELYDGTSKNFLAVLRQIRDGDGSNGTRYLQRPLPRALVKRFNWTLNNLLATGHPGDWDEAQHPEPNIDDQKQELVAAKGEERLEPAICREFQAALKAIAQDQPLILVFDKFTDGNQRLVSPDDFKLLVSHLFTPICNDPGARVKLVFSVNPYEKEVYGLTELPLRGVVSYVVPDNQTVEELVDYAAEMVWFTNESLVKGAAISLLSLPYDKPWRGIARLAAVRRALSEAVLNQIARMQ